MFVWIRLIIVLFLCIRLPAGVVCVDQMGSGCCVCVDYIASGRCVCVD